MKENQTARFHPASGAAALAAALALVLLTCALLLGLAWAPPAAQAAPIVPAPGELLTVPGPSARLAAGDVFTYVLGSDVFTLDPVQATDYASFLVAHQVLDTLFAFKPGGTLPVPALVAAWIKSADDLTWTFDLRPGVTFHDGTALDAAAVVFNFQRWWDEAHPYHEWHEYFQYMFGGFKGDPNSLLADVRASGPMQFQLVLTRPYGELPNTLAMAPFAIASPAAIQAGTFETHPVGSGPFTFIGREPGQAIHLAANPAYWGAGPYVDALNFQVIPDSGDRLAAVVAGTAHGADIDPTWVPTATGQVGLNVVWQPSLNTGYLGINRAHPPLDDPLVRQAIAHALDKQAYVHSHFNHDADVAQVATQLLPPAIWGRDEAIVDYAYDPALATSLLAQAGYTEGVTTTLWVIPMDRFYFRHAADMALDMQQDLLAAGIHVTLVTGIEWGTYLDLVGQGEADLFMLGWGGDNGHPANFFYPLLCDTYLRYGPRDDVLCAHLEAAQEEDDWPTLVEMYEWAGRRVHDTLPLVPIAHSRSARVLRDDVAGYFASPLGLVDFASLFYPEEQIEVPPDAPATLVYTDAAGSTTTLSLPIGAVTQTTTILFDPVDDLGRSAGFFARHAFVLDARRDGTSIPRLAFARPVSLTIEYTDDDVANLREDSLILLTWDGTRWTADRVPIVGRDLLHNKLHATLERVGSFRLHAARGYRYLPVVLNGATMGK